MYRVQITVSVPWAPGEYETLSFILWDCYYCPSVLKAHELILYFMEAGTHGTVVPIVDEHGEN